MKALLVILCATLICLSCELPHAVELERIASPDGRVEALFYRNADYGGATSGYTYSLYIVKTGEAPDTDHHLMGVDRIEDLEISWRDNKILDISYKYARIWGFTNWWHSPDIDDFSYVVEIHLNPLDENHFLSPYDRYTDTLKSNQSEPWTTPDVWRDTLESHK